MSFYPKIARNFVLPLGDMVMGTSVSKHLRFLEKSQWWSLEELENYQNMKLRALIKHAYENVPFYHEVFRARGLYPDDIKKSEDLIKLPILTKEIAREKFKNLLARDFKKWKPMKNKTGGTTGKPLTYYKSRESKSIGWATAFRAWKWAGYKYGDKKVTLAGSSLIPDKKIAFSKKMRYIAERNLALSAVHLSDEIMADYAKKIEKSQIMFIRGYPSSLFTFAKYLLKNNIYSIRPQAIFVTSEVLYQYQKKIIENAFDSKVYNHYSNPESRAAGYECEEQNGFHMNMESSIMEFVEIKDNERVAMGEPGEIVATDLFNYAMPFIRYKTEDVSTPSNEKCPCGRELPLMKSLEGRTTDIIKFSNGISLGGPALTLIFRDFNIKEYQLVQEQRDLLIIKIVKEEGYLDIETEQLLNIMKYHCGVGVEIKIDFVVEIPKSTSSKYRFIISNVSDDGDL